MGPGTSVFAPPGLGAAPGMSGRVVPVKLGDLHPGHPPLNCPVMYKNPEIVCSSQAARADALCILLLRTGMLPQIIPERRRREEDPPSP